MNVGDIVYDKDMKLFGKILSWKSTKEDGRVYEVKAFADKDGYSIKCDNFITPSASIIPYDVVVKEQIKNHERAVKNLKKLEQLDTKTKTDKLKKLMNDFLNGKVTQESNYDYEDWCNAVKYALKNMKTI